MTSRVVVETPRTEPCPEPGCVVPHMDRRVLQAGEYVLVEKVDGRWPKSAWVPLAEFAKSANWYPFYVDDPGLRSAARATLDALAGGSS
jgi:hypothetical protein